ncbi:MAG TPA: DUF4286 family protein [Candidatus Sphingobacterium stercorigallinarum]|nr:DUF4286 family protein [Candidatus Sphingobacterium stercorigallinarum]
MYLYNASLIVEESVHNDLIIWTKQLLATKSTAVRLLKMLDSPHEGHTYCLQVEVDSQEDIQELRIGLISELQQYIDHHHREKAFLFESVMEYLA